MENIIPRYEFRTFAQNFGLVEERMRKLAPCEKIREEFGNLHHVSGQ